MIHAFTHYLHLLSVCCFVGSVLCVHVLKVTSDKGGRDSSLLKAAVLVDRNVVAPSAILLTVTGLFLAWLGGKTMGMNWVTVLGVAWVVVAFVGIAILGPSLRRLADDGASGDSANDVWARHWNLVSATLLVMVALLTWLASFAVHG